jgi:hypothetical protein
VDPEKVSIAAGSQKTVTVTLSPAGQATNPVLHLSATLKGGAGTGKDTPAKRYEITVGLEQL